MNKHLDIYLEELHGEIIIGKCAGREADISVLHQNRLIEIDLFIRTINESLDVFGKKAFKKKFLKECKELLSSRTLEKPQDAIDKNVLDEFDTFSQDMHGGKSYLNRRQFLGLGFKLRDYMMENRKDSQGELDLPSLQPNFDLMDDLREKSKQVHMIYGDPGFGKTVHLQQFTERFVYEERSNPTETLPLYFKAKSLARYIKKSCSANFGIKDDDPNEVPRQGVVFSDGINGTELTATLVETILNRIPRLNKDTAEEVLKHHSKRVYIIDALDECAGEELLNVVKFMSEISMDEGTNIVATCRNSQSSDVIKMWEKMQDKATTKFHEFHIDFTKDELRREMPKKLTDAWGIDGQLMRYQVEKEFTNYEQVLTHPLFVGIFARLLTDKDGLADIEELENANVNMGTYTLRHVDFLNQVIDMGIELELKDRDYPGLTAERFRDIFCAISYAYTHAKSGTFHDLALLLRAEFRMEIEEKEMHALERGVGLLYSTDGSTVEWVHKTLYEIACARFIFSNPNSRRNVRRIASVQDECYILAAVLFEMRSKELSANDAIMSLVSTMDESKEISITEQVYVRQFITLHSEWNSELIESVEETQFGRYKLHPTKHGKKQAGLVDMLETIANHHHPSHLLSTQFKPCLVEYSKTKKNKNSPNVSIDWVPKLLEKSTDLLEVSDELGILPSVVSVLFGSASTSLSSATTQVAIMDMVSTIKLLGNFLENDHKKITYAFSEYDNRRIITRILNEELVSQLFFSNGSRRKFYSSILVSLFPNEVDTIINEAREILPASFFEMDKLEQSDDIISALLNDKFGKMVIQRVFRG